MEGFLNLIAGYFGGGFSLTYSLYRWGFLHFRYLKSLVIVGRIHPWMSPWKKRGHGRVGGALEEAMLNLRDSGHIQDMDLPVYIYVLEKLHRVVRWYVCIQGSFSDIFCILSTLLAQFNMEISTAQFYEDLNKMLLGHQITISKWCCKAEIWDTGYLSHEPMLPSTTLGKKTSVSFSFGAKQPW